MLLNVLCGSKIRIYPRSLLEIYKDLCNFFLNQVIHLNPFNFDFIYIELNEVLLEYY